VYWGLENIGYFHLTLKHGENFVCPNTGANTQLIENAWDWMKRRIKSRLLNKNGYFLLISAEFLLESKYKDDVVHKILRNLENSLGK
ncbi:hypothetical protein H312_03194, partial [Anncaliia algerae PRA339]